MYNWDGGAWGPQDMTGCMEHSLNVCLAWLADQIGPTNFYKYIQNFGIGHLTGIDLSGEATYPLRLPGDGQWFPVDLGTELLRPRPGSHPHSNGHGRVFSRKR